MSELAMKALSDQVEQLQVQLAGCGAAALGGIEPAVRAVRGQYGWSVAYQDVLDLRLKYEKLASDNKTLETFRQGYANVVRMAQEFQQERDALRAVVDGMKEGR